MFYQGLILAYLTTSVLENLEDMNAVCKKPGLHFCETYE